MTPRINLKKVWAGLFDGMMATSAYLAKQGWDKKLLALIEYRVSQINGCGYCLDMHYKDAIHLGETELRLITLPAWRECPYYSDKERAVLAFAESLTTRVDVDDETYDAVKSFFSEKEIAELTMVIAQINGWNRLNKTFRTVPGDYKVGQFA